VLVNVVLKRPLDLLSFSTFSEDNDEEEEDFETVAKRLPVKPNEPIDVIVLGDENPDNKVVRGRVAALKAYDGGERLLMLTPPELFAKATLVDATVSGSAVNDGGGARYKLKLTAPVPGSKLTEITADLNDYNHCVQRFADAAVRKNAQWSVRPEWTCALCAATLAMRAKDGCG
jgi:hypothetical protein